MGQAATVEPPVDETAAPPKRERKVSPREQASKPKRLPPYHVILLNDDDHTVDYVIEMLQKVFALKFLDAYRRTMEVHHKGQAVVWTGSKEVAELKRDQVRGFGPDTYASITVRYPLGVKLEPAPA